MSLYFARSCTQQKVFALIRSNSLRWRPAYGANLSQGTRQGRGFIRIMSGCAELLMLTTTLLSKYLAKQKTAREAERAKPLNAGVRANAFDDLDAGLQNESERLTAGQAQELRVRLGKTGSLISPWQIIVGQLLAGAVFAGLAWLITGKSSVAASVAYGALAVVIPAAVFARGLMSQFSSLNALTAGFGFFVWEMIKIVATVVLIAIAPILVADLDWLAMLIGLIVTMKVVFVLLWLLPKMD
jgi:ATP synthase protein I